MFSMFSASFGLGDSAYRPTSAPVQLLSTRPAGAGEHVEWLQGVESDRLGVQIRSSTEHNVNNQIPVFSFPPVQYFPIKKEKAGNMVHKRRYFP